MKRFLFLLISGMFLLGALSLAGCGQVTNEPAGDSNKDEPKSVSEQRNDSEQNEPEDLSKEQIVQENNKTAIEELTALEQQWSGELHNIVVKSDDLTDKWIYGEMVYNSYIMELYQAKEDFDRLYEESERVYAENGFAESLKDEPIYTKGLSHGIQLRETVKEFFDTTYGIGKDSTGEKTDLSGEDFKAFYQEKMVTEYNNHYRQLTSAISSLK